MYRLPLSQSDQRILSIFQSVYNDGTVRFFQRTDLNLRWSETKNSKFFSFIQNVASETQSAVLTKQHG